MDMWNISKYCDRHFGSIYNIPEPAFWYLTIYLDPDCNRQMKNIQSGLAMIKMFGMLNQKENDGSDAFRLSRAVVTD